MITRQGDGLSDWEAYANRLPLKLGCVNTFYHQEPFPDITSVDRTRSNEYNFIVSTDVYEQSVRRFQLPSRMRTGCCDLVAL